MYSAWSGTKNIQLKGSSVDPAPVTPTPTPTPVSPSPETPVTVPPTVITKLTDRGSGSLSIAWRSKGSEVDGYQLRWSQNSGFESGVRTASYTGRNNATRKGLETGKTYYVGVRTFKEINGKKVYSTWSGTKTIQLS